MRRFVEIQTPEQVTLRYELAGPGSRIAAGIIDLFIIWTAIGLIAAGLFASGQISISLSEINAGEMPASFTQFAFITIGISIFVLNIFYFILFDYLNSGQTVGKRSLEIQVKSYTGHAVSIESACVRNFARILDVLPGLYLAGLVSTLVTRHHQRIGDLMGGTVVIRRRKISSVLELFAGETYAQLDNPKFALDYTQIMTLDSGILTLLEEYFRRAKQLSESERNQLRAVLVTQFSPLIASGEISNNEADVFLKELYLCVRDHWTNQMS
ncbi:MAG: RDD family protein [Myxococcota bacterium]|nr:RDD family protein [Myxococcota bacterium]